jgi:prephenate dehydrogenase
MRIGIIGLGLMGGSFAMELQRLSYVQEVCGLDHNELHQKEALKLGLVDSIVQISEIKQCDLILLSIPASAIVEVLKDFTDIDSDATIIDFGSTKEYIIDSIPHSIRANIVPSHPMTGLETFGPKAATLGLFKDKTIVFCDTDKSGELQLSLATKIFKDIDMKIVYMDAKKHDFDTAFISHMPHIVSFALANCVLKEKSADSILQLAGGGFKDMSRIAKSSPNMWRDICKQNKKNLIYSIDKFQEELKKSREFIKLEQWDKLGDWMSEANILHKIL